MKPLELEKKIISDLHKLDSIDFNEAIIDETKVDFKKNEPFVPRGAISTHPYNYNWQDYEEPKGFEKFSRRAEANVELMDKDPVKWALRSKTESLGTDPGTKIAALLFDYWKENR